MEIEVLQPWDTISGTASAVTTVVQDEEEWLDVSKYSDVSAWIDVREVTALGSLTLTLESSPTKDEIFFVPIATIPFLTASTTPFVVKSVAGASSSNPIARWLRWRLTSVGVGGGQWAATFRIRIAQSRTPHFAPTQVPGLQMWLRADLGVTIGQSPPNVSAWQDQSGLNSGNNLTATNAPQFEAGMFNGFPAIEVGTYGSVNNYFTSASGVNVAQPSSLIAVFQASGVGANNQTIIGGPNATHPQFDLESGTANALELYASSGAAASLAVATTTLSIVQVDWNGSATNVYQNGTLQTTVNPGTGSWAFSSVGASSVGGLPFTGWIAELIGYKPALTPAWRTLITRYLGSRYAIAVP